MLFLPLLTIITTIISIPNVSPLTITQIQTPVILDSYPSTFQITLAYTPQELLSSSSSATSTSDETNSNIAVIFDILKFNQQQLITTFPAQPIWETNNQTQTVSLTSTFTLPSIIIDGLGYQTITINASIISSSSNKVISSTSTNIELLGVQGGVSIIPVIATLLVAMLTRNVVPSLFVGVWLAALIKYNGDVVDASIHSIDELILNAATDYGHAAIIAFSLFLGGIVAMTTRSGGLEGFSSKINKIAKSSRGAQGLTMFAGACVFFDDYANLLLTGAVMRPITDDQLISREKLAFIVDAMAAPVAAIVPISSWTAFEALLIHQEHQILEKSGLPIRDWGYETSGFTGFMRMVPYMFYPVFIIVFQITVIVTQLEFGPMLTAERRAKYKKQVQVDFVREDMVEEKVLIADDDPDTLPDELTPRLWYNAFFPIITLICVTIGAMIGIGYRQVPQNFRDVSAVFANTDGVLALLYSTSTTVVFTGLFYRLQYRRDENPENDPDRPPSEYFILKVLPQKINYYLGRPFDEELAYTIPLMGLRESVEMMLYGIKSMAPACVVLVLAWAIGSAVAEIGAPHFFARALSGQLTITGLSPTVFIVSSLTSIATGSSFGTMALLFPVISPLAFSLAGSDSESYYKCLAAILSGSVFGGHISPISDTTILTSLSTRCDLQQHVITQLPYASVCALWAVLIGYLPQTHPAVGNFVGIALTILTVLFLGAPVSSPRGRLDPITWLYTEFYVRILKGNPAKLECLRLRVIVIEQEGDKDDVVGQGIRRDYLIWSMRRAFGESRLLLDINWKNQAKSDAEELKKEIEVEDEMEILKEKRKSRTSRRATKGNNNNSSPTAGEDDQRKVGSFVMGENNNSPEVLPAYARDQGV
jgi:Na+/H+ antiporter NhaC